MVAGFTGHVHREKTLMGTGLMGTGLMLCCLCLGADGKKKKIIDLDVLPKRVLDAAWTEGLRLPAHEPDYERAVRWWLRQGGNIDARCPSRFDSTMLHAAVINNHPNVLKLLLEHGADVNAPEGYGYTPLMQAANFGTEVILQALLAAGADVHAQQVTQPFSERDPTAREDEGGYDQMRRDMLGTTALHHAVLSERKGSEVLSMVKALLAAGATTLARDNEGRTPVELAERLATPVEGLKQTMMEYREDDESSFSNDVCTAQHAIYYDNDKPARRWVRDGRNVDDRCEFQGEGSTLLMAAAHKGHDNLARWLLRNGASGIFAAANTKKQRYMPLCP